jgi:lipid-binding SYLF domain-containing protein
MKRIACASMLVMALAAALITCVVGVPRAAAGDSKSELDENAVSALENLTSKVPAARDLADRAVAILVFPGVYKAGFVVGAQRGEGVLLKNGRPQGHYKTGGASYGLQAGAQKYGYALMFMSEDAVNYLERSNGWEIGMGPSVVVVDEGMGKTLTTTTAKKDIYAFIFDQKGLMAGLGLQGNKITKID